MSGRFAHEEVLVAYGALRSVVAIADRLHDYHRPGGLPINPCDAPPEKADAAFVFGVLDAVNAVAGFGCIGHEDGLSRKHFELPDRIVEQLLPLLRAVDGMTTYLLDATEEMLTRGEDGSREYPPGWVRLMELLCGLQRVAQCGLQMWAGPLTMKVAA